MHDQIPWNGGISNRQILADSLRAVTVFAAVGFSLLALAWWLTGYINFANPNLRVGICAGLAAVVGYPVARWCRA
jgi:hypothetical protein